GMVVYDVRAPLAPKRIGRFAGDGDGVHRIVWTGGRYAHASFTPDGHGDRIWGVFDLADPTAPSEVTRWELDEPQPAGKRFAEQPTRFGPHNLHENRAGSYRSAALVFATYFNAGLRVYDLTDPEGPEEVASWVPDQEAPQSNDLYVEAGGRVWVTDRFAGGL